MSSVEVDPARQCGEPCIGGTRIPTRQVGNLIYAGESIERVLEMWPHISRRGVLVACWYEARHGKSRALRRGWREWSKGAAGKLWHSEGELPEAPPADRGEALA